MAWEVEYTHEFERWWDRLGEDVQDVIAAKVELLTEHGPYLRRPHVVTLAISAYPNMKELRVQHGGDAYRVLFAFDPRRVAILLLGGRKPDERWYKKAVKHADRLYKEHLQTLKKEGLLP